MKVEFAIIHELIKTQQDNEGKINLSKNLLSNDETNTLFISKLHDLFTKHVYNYSYALFANEEKNEDDINKIKKFPNFLKDFLKEKNNNTFKLLTENLMNCLIFEIKNKRFVKGGYIVFTLYKNEKQYFMVNMIRKTDAFTTTNGNAENIRPEIIEHLDLDKLAMACQIDLQKLEEKKERYLKFTKNSNMKDVSDYFFDWLNIDTNTKSSTNQNNNALIDIINRVEPLPKDGDKNLTRDEFKKQALDFIKSRPDKIINLFDMGSHFFPDEPNTFLDYASSNSINIDTEFNCNNSILKKLWKFEVVEDNIRLAFNYEDKNKIKVINETTVLIESPNLAKSVRAAIEEEERYE